MTSGEQGKPLAGLRVLDLTRLLPGPVCTLYLADLGADVIKIEDDQGGDYTRTLNPELFAVANRNKRGLTLDLRKAEDCERLKALVAGAEVLVESFRPGVMDRLGVGYDVLKAVNPRLLYCAITGYGRTGPYRDKAGHDINYRGYTGHLEQGGRAGGQPDVSNFQLADLGGGALTAAFGILAAVLRARATGQGGYLDAAMLDGTLAMQVVPLATLRQAGQTRPRGRDMLSGGLPNYDVYECADGKYLALGALEPKFWMGFCQALARPDLANMPMGVGDEAEPTRAAMRELIRGKTRDEWTALLAEHDVCATPVLTLAEALENEQVVARGMVCQVDGKPQFACPVKLDGFEFEVARPAPKPGEHSDEILAEIE
jgi:crotonobetainyl-CoA:carnitine CoA-transferase CaiB-like acyl-CoA transferase